MSYSSRGGHGYGKQKRSNRRSIYFGISKVENASLSNLRHLVSDSKSAVKDEQAGITGYEILARETNVVGLPKVRKVFLSHARDEKRHKREDIAALKKIKAEAKKYSP